MTAKAVAVDPRRIPMVAIIDVLPGQHRLLAATLRALGCQVYLIDCTGHWPASLDAQLDSQGPFDAVFWDLSAGMPSHPWAAALAGGAGSFGDSRFVIAAVQGQQVPRVRRPPDEQTLLLTPFTPSTLMATVNAAVSSSRHSRSPGPTA